ncbi:hypothetical protein EDC04DRAFT_741338 [Pisolithus marmoratus]|nr:hypothetical protein EDC04DRAFT_741338 [Pisolithus marmoratus]
MNGWGSLAQREMDPYSGSPKHADVKNPRSYTLVDALGRQPTQQKTVPSVAPPTYPRKDIVAGRSSLPYQPGLIGQSSSYGAYNTNQGAAYTPTAAKNINHAGRGNEIRYHPSTSYAPAGTQDKTDGNECADCPPKKCRYPGPGGNHCLQVITCKDVSEHLIIHGITNMSRDKMITCHWDGCSADVSRHNFVRHIREKHFQHKRKAAGHGSKKGERGQPTSTTGPV